MPEEISSQEISAILDILAKILATGLGPEQRERALQGTIHRKDTNSINGQRAIFETLKLENRTSGNLDFVLAITERIRSIRSFYQDVGADLEMLESLLAKNNLRTSTAPANKPYVFVLMPFREDFKATYEQAVRPILRDELGCIVENADELHTTAQIIEDVFSQIKQADFLLADTTGKNPNVFYEMGYAHAMGKRVILLAQDALDIPFDVRGLRHIIYSPDSLATLRFRLKQTARAIIEAIPKSLPR